MKYDDWDIDESAKKFDSQQINRYQIVVSAMSGSASISDPRMGKPSLPNVLENVAALSIIHKSGEVYKCKHIQITTEIIFVFWSENIVTTEHLVISGVNEQTQSAYTCSKLTIETLELGVTYVQS